MEKWSKNEKSWERQQDESVQAYEALNLYLSMGAERTLHKVATKLSKSDTLIKRWSSSWNWQQRCRDYDNELKRNEFDEKQRQIKAMQKRQIQNAMLLQKKAADALKKLDIEKLSPQEILRFISEGAKLEKDTRQDSALTSAKEAGTTGERSSIADTIIAAYEKRKEDGNA